MNYNGMYDQQVEVIITSEQSDTSLLIAGKIKNLCKAWSFSVDVKEYKWKKHTLSDKRSVVIRQIDYAGDIIAFRESLRCICFHYDLYLNATVEIMDRGTIPKDSRTNLIG